MTNFLCICISCHDSRIQYDMECDEWIEKTFLLFKYFKKIWEVVISLFACNKIPKCKTISTRFGRKPLVEIFYFFPLLSKTSQIFIDLQCYAHLTAKQQISKSEV